jgi:hypothetical protein
MSGFQAVWQGFGSFVSLAQSQIYFLCSFFFQEDSSMVFCDSAIDFSDPSHGLFPGRVFLFVSGPCRASGRLTRYYIHATKQMVSSATAARSGCREEDFLCRI